MWLSQLNTLSVASFQLALRVQEMTALALWKALHRMSRVTVLGTAIESLQSCFASVAFFFFLLHQAYQSSLPKVLTLNQPVWCQRSIKLMIP